LGFRALSPARLVVRLRRFRLALINYLTQIERICKDLKRSLQIRPICVRFLYTRDFACEKTLEEGQYSEAFSSPRPSELASEPWGIGDRGGGSSKRPNLKNTRLPPHWASSRTKIMVGLSLPQELLGRWRSLVVPGAT